MTDDNRDQIKKAVALNYSKEDSAPKITASGKGIVAEKIINKANELDIPIKKDQDLTHILAELDIGEEIPADLYEVIAEILSYFYSLEELI